VGDILPESARAKFAAGIYQTRTGRLFLSQALAGGANFARGRRLQKDADEGILIGEIGTRALRDRGEKTTTTTKRAFLKISLLFGSPFFIVPSSLLSSLVRLLFDLRFSFTREDGRSTYSERRFWLTSLLVCARNTREQFLRG